MEETSGLAGATATRQEAGILDLVQEAACLDHRDVGRDRGELRCGDLQKGAALEEVLQLDGHSAHHLLGQVVVQVTVTR